MHAMTSIPLYEVQDIQSVVRAAGTPMDEELRERTGRKRNHRSHEAHPGCTDLGSSLRAVESQYQRS